MIKEKRIIQELIKSHYDNGDLSYIKEIISRLNINRLIKISSRLGIEAFLYETINKKQLDSYFPEVYLDYLKKSSGLIAIKNNFIGQEAKIILDILNREKIEYIVVKGIATAGRIYPSSNIRSISDIDILIKKEQYPQLKEIVNKNGYHFLEYLMEVNTNNTQDNIEEEFSEVSFIKSTRPYDIHLDVHFDLSGFLNSSKLRDYYPDNFSWFENREELIIDGVKIYGLNLQAEFLNMIYHFSIHHSFLGVKWLIDLCQLIKYHQQDIDLKLLMDMGTDHQKKLITVCLRMVEEMIGFLPFENVKLEDLSLFSKMEYIYYTRMAYKDLHSLKSKLSYRFVKVILPVSVKAKIQLFKYYFFDINSIKHRLKKGSDTKNMLLPFELIKIAVSDYRRNKKGL